MESGITRSSHPTDCHWHRDWHACNCGLFNVLTYNEPGPNEEIVTKRITVEDAIDSQICYAKTLGYTYSSQDEALQDFIANHWASYEVI